MVFNIEVTFSCSVTPPTRYHTQQWIHHSMFRHTPDQIPRATSNSPLHVPSHPRPDTMYNIELTAPCSVTRPTRYHVQHWTHPSMFRHIPDQIPCTTWNSPLHVPSHPRPDTMYNIELTAPCSVTPPTRYHVQHWTHPSMFRHTPDQIPCRHWTHPSMFRHPPTRYHVQHV